MEGRRQVVELAEPQLQYWQVQLQCQRGELCQRQLWLSRRLPGSVKGLGTLPLCSPSAYLLYALCPRRNIVGGALFF